MCTDLLQEATQFSRFHHYDQFRKDGTPYVFHPVRVLGYVLNFYGSRDQGMLCAALLHDVIEDCGVTPENIKINFGEDIANLVVELTNVYIKPDYPDLNSKQRRLLEHARIRNISVRAKKVKLADRMDNMCSAYNHPGCGFLKYYRDDTESLLNAINLPDDELFKMVQMAVHQKIY